ncbi:hypothetical protein Tco_0671924 [Tanacetum coccineum]
MVPSKVIAEEMVIEDTIDGDDGDVIPTKVYDAMVAQEMLEDQAGIWDVVIPHEVYAIMVAAEGFFYTEDRDVVIPTEVYDAMVAQEMLEYQTRAIKRRRVMVDKEDKDNAE